METLIERSISSGQRDDQLIERLRLGDLDAFETFYKAYRPKLRGFIRNIVSVEEAVDEVFDDRGSQSARKRLRGIAFASRRCHPVPKDTAGKVSRAHGCLAVPALFNFLECSQ